MLEKELLRAIEPLLEAWDEYKNSDANMEQAYYKLAKYPWGHWERLKELVNSIDKSS